MKNIFVSAVALASLFSSAAFAEDDVAGPLPKFLGLGPAWPHVAAIVPNDGDTGNPGPTFPAPASPLLEAMSCTYGVSCTGNVGGGGNGAGGNGGSCTVSITCGSKSAVAAHLPAFHKTSVWALVSSASGGGSGNDEGNGGSCTVSVTCGTRHIMGLLPIFLGTDPAWPRVVAIVPNDGDRGNPGPMFPASASPVAVR